MSGERCFFFGCAERSGRNMFGSKMQPPTTFEERNRASYYGGTEYISVDSTLAPRRVRAGCVEVLAATKRQAVDLFWIGMGVSPGARYLITTETDECPEGQFLLHHLDNGFTAIAWWDRSQGDEREGGNSVLLLEGKHTAAEMIAALREHFPNAVIHLNDAEVELVEVSGAAAPKPAPPPKPAVAAASATKAPAPKAASAAPAPKAASAPAPAAPAAPAAKKP